MIISFTAQNFKSIKEKQTLDLYAENLKYPHIRNVAFPFDNDDKFGVLKTIGVYGANASGKSNLLEAMSIFQDMVNESHQFGLDKEIPYYKPFKLDEESKIAPTIFELEFIGLDRLKYTYKFEFSKYQIEKETLDFYPKGKIANLFTRKTNKDGSFNFVPGGYLKGRNKTIACKKNNLYVSVAADTEGAPEAIKDVYRFIATRINYLTPSMGIRHQWLGDESYREGLALLLSCADTGIYKINEAESNDIPDFPMDKIPQDVQEKIKENFKWKPIFWHNEIEEDFDLDDESKGTKRLYDIAPLILMSLPRGEVTIIDEISNSMHPELSAFLIELFNDPVFNPNNAQLIFTTHDITLMNQDTMRRDQISFTEKDSKGQTELYCLDDFKEVRNDTPFAKWYKERRFGAVPKINFKKFRESFLAMLEELRQGDK